jgi:Fe-S oxidoreductase
MTELLHNRFESLQDIRFSRVKCIRCNMCKFPPLARVESHAHSMGCPAYEHFQFTSSSGGGLVIMANSLMEGRAEVSDAVQKTVYGCTLCGLCDVSCKFSTDIEVLETLFLLRKHLFEQGRVYPQHRAILDRIRSDDHPLLEHASEQHQARGWASDEQADTLVWIGSHFGYDIRHYGWLIQMLALLDRGGLRYKLLFDDEPCSARAALEIGDWTLFKEQSQKVATAIRDAHVREVICLDAEDYSTLRSQTRKHAAIEVPIRHVTEVYAQLLGRGKLKPLRRPPAGGVAWHDPCYLGRLGNEFQDWQGHIRSEHGIPVYEPARPIHYGDGGVFEAPRVALKQLLGRAPLEFERRREYSFNAGETGQAQAVMPQFARATATRRLQEARNLGFRTVVTECPQALQSLAAVADDLGIAVRSLTSLLADAIGGDA